MDKNDLFTSAIDCLKNVTSIKKIFAIEKIDEINDRTFLNFKKRYKPKTFYSKRLPDLINELPLLTSRDFYDDSDFNKVSVFLNSIKDEFDNNDDLLNEYIKAHVSESAKLYCLLLMFLCTGYMELKTKDSMNLLSFINDFKHNNGLNTKFQYFWYRGVTNIDDFDLMPSMYRPIKDAHVHINDLYVDSLYSKNKLDTEYSQIFHSSDRLSFFAYMQHSIAYSPLIDFTNNINIAGSFATNFTNSTEFETKDAGIYMLVRDTRMKNPSPKIDIELFNKKLSPLTLIFGKPLMFCLLSDFYVQYYINLNQTNDRMRYQDGLFFFISKAVFVKGKLLFPNSTTRLFVIRIPFKGKTLNKDKIIADIEQNHKQFCYDYLMNPYLWFSKRHK